MVLLRERERSTERTLGCWPLLGGLALGLSVLTRPITPPLAILVALWFLFRLSLGPDDSRLLPVALLSGLVLAPWIVRNYGVFNAFRADDNHLRREFLAGQQPVHHPLLSSAGYDVQWTARTDDGGPQQP